MAMAILSAALFIGCGTSSKDAYESFSLIMNKLVGEGKWSDKGHEDKLKDGALIVNGLTVTLPPVVLPEGLKAAMAEASGQDVSNIEDQPRTMTFAKVEIKNIVDKKSMAGLAALTDWRGQKALKLADQIILKAVTQQVPFVGDLMESSIEEVNISSPALAASASDAPDGLPGFLKAFSLSKFSYKNFKMTGLNQNMKMDAAIAEIAAEKVAFDGEPFKALDVFDPSGMSSIGAAMSCQSASLKNFTMTMEGVDSDSQGDFRLHMGVDSITQKGAAGMGKVEDLALSGLKYEIIVKEKNKKDEEDQMPPISFTLASLNMKGFDMSLYLKKLAPLFTAIATNPDSANEVMSQIQTLGDLFVSPVSIDELQMNNLALTVGDMFSLKMAEAGLTGPYTAGQIAPSHKSYLKGLEVILPEDAKFNKGSTKDLYEFGQQFGMTRFAVEGESEGSYNPETGLLSSQTTRLAVKDLFELSGGAEFGGLTKERVDTLNNTTLSMALMAMLMAPDQVLGDLSFNKLNMKLDDKGITNRILAYTANQASGENESSKVSVEDMRKMTIATIKTVMDIRGREILANPEVLAQALADFYTEPQSLELRLDAQPVLSFKSAMSAGGDINKVLDTLNISVSANGKSSPPLKFAIDSAASLSGSPDDLIIEEYDEID